MQAYADAFAMLILAAGALTLVAIQAISLWALAHFLRVLQVARQSKLSADTTELTLKASEDAVNDIRDFRPGRGPGPNGAFIPDEEFRAWARADTQLSESDFTGQYPSTDNNDIRHPNPDDVAEIPESNLYAD